MHNVDWKRKFHRRLLKWFERNQRDLPWRKNKTAYRVWVSEIMLQQTQVATVIDYFQRFMDRFPTVNALAAADESDVLKMWEGLGYYRRARQLHQAAQLVVTQHGGQFPHDFAEVIALPGIGRYTAGAILSIACEQRHPILEGNTIRLFARLMPLEGDPKSSQNQRALWNFSESVLPADRCGDFNQALMELGSEICTLKSPSCPECPIQDLCPTFARGLQKRIPASSRKTRYESVDESVIIARRGGKYLVRLCGDGERWTGLWDFPRFKTHSRQHRARELASRLRSLTGLTAELVDSGQTIKHAVTRFRITLDCFHARELRGRLARNNGERFKWLTASQLEEYPMSATGRKIATRLLSGKM